MTRIQLSRIVCVFLLTLGAILPLSTVIANSYEQTNVSLDVNESHNASLKPGKREPKRIPYEFRTLEFKTGIYIGIGLFAVFLFVSVAIGRSDKTYAYLAVIVFELMLESCLHSDLGRYWFELQSSTAHHLNSVWTLAIIIACLTQVTTIRFRDASIQWLNPSMIGLFLLALVANLLLSGTYSLYVLTAVAGMVMTCYSFGFVKSSQNKTFKLQAVDVSFVILSMCGIGLLIVGMVHSQEPFSGMTLIPATLVALTFVHGYEIVKFNCNTAQNDNPVVSQKGSEAEELQQALSSQNFELQITLRELQERNQQLEKLNTLDALSGIHNRRHFDKRLLAELRRARRELTPLALIMFDIDHFKAVNDNYGHLTGDEVIRSVAHTAAELLNRPSDEAFRYGGEEFALILPNTDQEGALLIAEKVRQAIESLAIASNAGTVQCTVSLGVAASRSRQALTPLEFIEQADSALYKAKQSGRNQVILFNEKD